jgi:aminoglycoside phosphotransferase (APT) family kinase protein
VAPDDFDGGWDNRVRLVDGRWVERTPRFPDREDQLRREAALLPWLAPRVPLPVPVPEVVSEDPFTIRYAYLPGDTCAGTSAAQGEAVGAFLGALHSLDPAEAAAHGAWDAATWHGERVASLERMRADVLPLLPHHVAAAGAALLDRMSDPPPDPRLVHGDLGPEHVRTSGDRVTGVIDWGDAGLGDPAIDLAWTVLGSDPAFGRAVVTAYRPEEAVLVRGRDFHQLGPWHEVLYGLGEGGPAFVESGLAGTVSRLERFGTTTFRGTG